MKRGFELGGRFRENPIGSEGKSVSQRKAARDGKTWTPTESRLRDKLMRQFVKGTLDGTKGNSAAYTGSPLWCRGCDGRRMAVEGGLCGDCAWYLEQTSWCA